MVVPVLLILGILIYPGLLFSIAYGGILVWVYRKVKARMQGRRGPPWYQTYADITKLLVKETIIPRRAWKIGFTGAPLISIIAFLVIMLLLPVWSSKPTLGFLGDAIVLLYLLTIPTFAIILGGLASGSPYGIVGAGREASLLVWYELPLWFSIIVVLVLAKTLNIQDIAAAQAAYGPYLAKAPLAFIAFIIAAQAKLTKRPFDIPHAEVEIIVGPYTEYSGVLRAFLEINEAFKWLVISAVAATFFLGWPMTANPLVNTLLFIIKVAIFALIFTVIDVINPRFRIEQANLPLWKIALVLALIDLVRIVLGIGV